MKILVTGGAGFIASHITDAYISLGHDVVVVDNLSTGLKDYVNKRAKLYQVDICDQEKINQIMRMEKPDVVSHHAAQISVRVSVEDPILDAKVNILGLLNILESGRKNGMKKVIFASSGGVVYGDAGKIPTSENYFPQEPISPYGVAKLASENYLHFYYQAYKIPYVALRYSNVYGPRQNPHGEAGVVAIFILKLLRGENPVINGDGKQTRDYIYVKDVVRANVAALSSEIVGSFNIGTGIETNVVEIYEKLKSATGCNVLSKYGPAKSGEQKRSCLDCSKALKELGWKVETSLTEGFEKTVEHFREHEKN